MVESERRVYGREEEGPWYFRFDDRFATGNWSTRTRVPDPDPASETGWRRLPWAEEQRDALIARGILHEDGSTVDTRRRAPGGALQLENRANRRGQTRPGGQTNGAVSSLTHTELEQLVGTAGMQEVTGALPDAQTPHEAGRRTAESDKVTLATLNILTRILTPDSTISPLMSFQHTVRRRPHEWATHEQPGYTNPANGQRSHYPRRRGGQRR